MVVELTKLLTKLCEQESRDAEVAVVAGCVLATGRTLLIFHSFSVTLKDILWFRKGGDGAFLLNTVRSYPRHLNLLACSIPPSLPTSLLSSPFLPIPKSIANGNVNVNDGFKLKSELIEVLLSPPPMTREL